MNEEECPIIGKFDEQDKKQRKGGPLIAARYWFAILGCLGFANVYAMRVNLSVAMVAMVNTSALHVDNSANLSHECPVTGNGTSAHPSSQDGEFVWDEKLQGIILGSFFWGYIVTQIPGGRLAEVFSGKWVYGCGILCTSVFTLLTPLAARAGVWYLVAVRVLEGLGEGVTFPAMHAMMSHWAPPYERSKLITIVFNGSLLGTIFGLPLSGLLCQHGFDGGWPSVFYVFGAIGIVWFGFWAVFAYDKPENHPWITTEERVYIQESLGYTSILCEKSPSVPWKKIFTSMPVYAIMVAHFGQNWGMYTLLTELPSYLKNILLFDIEKNSYMSALPYLGGWMCSIFSSTLCDYLREKRILTTTRARNIFNTLGQVLPAVCLLGVTVSGCNVGLSFSFLVLAMTTSGAAYAGYQGNHVDIAPKFAGTLLGITNTVATIPGWMGPYVVGSLTQGQQTRRQWSKAFYITAAIYLASAAFYFVFSKGEEQHWNKVLEEESDCSEDEKVVYERQRKRQE